MLFFLVVIGSLIGAVILRAAAKWAENLEFPFGAAYTTVLLTHLINFAIGLPIGFVLGASGAGKGAELAMQVILLPVGFLIQSAMISSRHNLPFAKGAKIAGFMLLIGLLIVVVVYGIAFVVIMATSR
jgi:hypothetical protein